MAKQQEQTNTNRLRAMWTQSASSLVTRLRDGEPVAPGEVEHLQKALEGIEGREQLERVNDLTRENDEG